MCPAIDHYYSFTHYALVLGKCVLGVIRFSQFHDRLRFRRDVGV